MTNVRDCLPFLEERIIGCLRTIVPLPNAIVPLPSREGVRG